MASYALLPLQHDRQAEHIVADIAFLQRLAIYQQMCIRDRETEVSRWYHQKIPDWRKMILLSAVILSIMSLLISMLGNMEMMNQLLTS